MKKLTRTRIFLIIASGLLLILTTNCEKEKVPVLTTLPVNYISQNSVTSGGEITSDEGSDVTERGVCYGTDHNPNIDDLITADGAGSGSFLSAINDLNANTTYYLRAYATNTAGTGYGNEISFRTWHEEIVYDLDGNPYHVVTIGSQDWLVENLKVTQYNNGDPVSYVPDNTEWDNMSTGAYCDYNNDDANSAIYGRLYNWFAASDGRNLAPEGWHVSTDAEWTDLANHLGGEAVAGGKLKETGFTHWLEPNSEATNETGFSGLPGGGRTWGGIYEYINGGGTWWTSSSDNGTDGWIRYLDHGAFDVWRYVDPVVFGRSIRCVRN